MQTLEGRSYWGEGGGRGVNWGKRSYWGEVNCSNQRLLTLYNLIHFQNRSKIWPAYKLSGYQAFRLRVCSVSWNGLQNFQGPYFYARKGKQFLKMCIEISVPYLFLILVFKIVRNLLFSVLFFFFWTVWFLGMRFKIALRWPQTFQGPYFYEKKEINFGKYALKFRAPSCSLFCFSLNCMEKAFKIADGMLLNKKWNRFLENTYRHFKSLRVRTKFNMGFASNVDHNFRVHTFTPEKEINFRKCAPKIQVPSCFLFFVQTCMEKAFKISDGIFSTKKWNRFLEKT